MRKTFHLHSASTLAQDQETSRDTCFHIQAKTSFAPSATLPAQKLSTLNPLAREKHSLKHHCVTNLAKKTWKTQITPPNPIMRGTFVCSQYNQCTAVYPILQNTGERWARIWQKYRRWTAKRHAKFKLTKYFPTFSHATARSEHYWIVSNSSIMLKHALKHIKTGRVTKIRALGGHFSQMLVQTGKPIFRPIWVHCVTTPALKFFF